MLSPSTSLLEKHNGSFSSWMIVYNIIDGVKIDNSEVLSLVVRSQVCKQQWALSVFLGEEP